MDLVFPMMLFITLCDVVHGSTSRGNKRKGGSNKNRPPDRDSSTSVIENLLHGDSYNRQEAPAKGRPTEVKLGIYINSFYAISEQTMDYQVSMYLRQQWLDRRLMFEPPNHKLREIRMGDQKWNEIWVPDTFFRNEKRASFHEIMVPNRLLKLNASGFLWYVTKISATLSCPMRLQRYPLDTQRCPMMFESFGYTMDTMYFQWLESPVDVDKNVEIAQFTLVDKIMYDCSQNYTAGAFPCLEIQFVLRRDIGFFLIQVYIPTILIVILSWVAFWINIDAIPARVSLGLLTVLTMTTQSSGARSTLPRVSYIKAIDVWMSMCLIFVFSSLLEFAVVNVISRKEVRTIKPVRRPIRRDMDPESQLDQTGHHHHHHHNQHEEKHQNIHVWRRKFQCSAHFAGKASAVKIDKFSRKSFPLLFLLFNIVYWIYYTLPEPEPTALG